MPPDVARPRRRWRSAPPRRLVLRPLAAAACAVVLLAAGIGLGAWLDRDPIPEGQLVLAPIGDRDPSASGNIAVSDDGVTVRVSGLQPTDDDQFYELWLLGADKELVGLGSFRVGEDGAATLKLPLPVNPDAFQYFDLSLEPGDGDPGTPACPCCAVLPPPERAELVERDRLRGARPAPRSPPRRRRRTRSRGASSSQRSASARPACSRRSMKTSSKSTNESSSPRDCARPPPSSRASSAKSGERSPRSPP